MLERFADAERGGFFSTAADHEQLVARRKDLEDAPIPSGGSAAAFGLLRLAALTGERRYEEAARRPAAAAAHDRAASTRPRSATCCRRSTSTLADVREVAIVGDDRGPLERVVREAFRPHVVLAGGEPAACRCSRAASRSTAGPPPTCASASPAGGR